LDGVLKSETVRFFDEYKVGENYFINFLNIIVNEQATRPKVHLTTKAITNFVFNKNSQVWYHSKDLFEYFRMIPKSLRCDFFKRTYGFAINWACGKVTHTQKKNFENFYLFCH
jgi:hypothetical protein